MKKQVSPSYGFYVGHSLETSQEITNAILKVLEAPHADETTKRKALEVLKNVFHIQNVSFTNCSVNTKPSDQFN